MLKTNPKTLLKMYKYYFFRRRRWPQNPLRDALARSPDLRGHLYKATNYFLTLSLCHKRTQLYDLYFSLQLFTNGNPYLRKIIIKI